MNVLRMLGMRVRTWRSGDSATLVMTLNDLHEFLQDYPDEQAGRMLETGFRLIDI